MKKLALLVVIGVALAAGVWTTMAWVGADGAVLGWSAGDGVLVVPGAGAAWLPRWRYRRLEAREVSGTVDGASREGVRVEARVTLDAPVGRWRLAAAADPSAGLVAAALEPVKSSLASFPLGCLIPGAGAAGCPPEPRVAVRNALAEALELPPGRLSVTLQPDAGAVRGFLLGRIRERLPDAGRKVVMVGLDGVGWDRVLPYVEKGLMPNVARLMGRGTWGEMKTLVPMLSPLIWTTMATGYSPDEHGILDFVQRDPESGKVVPTTSRQRRVPAIWNIASAMGKTTDVVAWWATWPAERVNGVMISDRLYYSLTAGATAESWTTASSGVVFPADRQPRFMELRERAEKETDWRVVRYFIDVPEATYDAAEASGEGWSDPIDGFRRTLIATRLYFGSAVTLAADHPDLLMVYIEGTDEIGHIMAPYMPPPTVEIDPARAAVLTASVPRYFQIVDRWIGRLLARCPLDQYTFFVLSDHGFRWGKTRPKRVSGTAGPTAPLWHKQPAVYLLAGNGVKRLGRVKEWQSVYDVAPTLAALLGVPPEESWRGKPVPGAPENRLAPIRYAPLVPPSSYQVGGEARAEVSPEFIAKMKSLGYLSGGGEKPLVSAGEAARRTPPAQPTPSATAPDRAPEPTPTIARIPLPRSTAGESPLDDATTTPGQLNNLAVIKINQKKYDEARRLLERAMAMNPASPGPPYNLRRMYMELGRYDEADKQLWIAIDKGLREPERSLDRAAADYESLNKEERAEALLAKAVDRFPDHEPFWAHLIVVKIRLHRCDEAVKVGARAARRFPDSGPVHSFYGTAAACAGDADTARREIERALEIKPDQPMLRNMLKQLEEGGSSEE